jgi:hypothetical protein
MGLVEVAKLDDSPEEKEKVLDYILSSAAELDLVIKEITTKTKIDHNS